MHNLQRQLDDAKTDAERYKDQARTLQNQIEQEIKEHKQTKNDLSQAKSNLANLETIQKAIDNMRPPRKRRKISRSISARRNRPRNSRSRANTRK